VRKRGKDNATRYGTYERPLTRLKIHLAVTLHACSMQQGVYDNGG